MDYTRRAARWLLGATDHPGGEALTAHLLDRLALPLGSTVLDVACGRGATLRAVRDRGLRALGVDVEPGQVQGVEGGVVADARALPVATASLDAVLVECSLSTFDDAPVVLAEVFRVLRPGGVVGLTDVTLDRGRADAAVVSAVDRLTGARSEASYRGLLTAAGLTVTAVEDRRQDASALIRRLRRRLPLSRTLRACERAVEDGALGYVLLLAERPVS